MLDAGLVVFLTSIIPGSGHWYAGHKWRGSTFFISGYLLIGGLSTIALKLLCYTASLKTRHMILFSLLCMFAILAVWIWLLRDAYLITYRINLRQGVSEKQIKFYKNAWFCAFFSRVIPGFGQIFAGRVVRGIIFILLYILTVKFFVGFFLSILKVIVLAVIVRDAFECGQTLYPSNYKMNSRLFLFIAVGIMWTNLIFPSLIFKLVKLWGG